MARQALGRIMTLLRANVRDVVRRFPFGDHPVLWHFNFCEFNNQIHCITTHRRISRHTDIFHLGSRV